MNKRLVGRGWKDACLQVQPGGLGPVGCRQWGVSGEPLKAKGRGPPAPAISLTCLAPLSLAGGEGGCVEERVNACKPMPASPGEPGSTSNSPWKTVGTLDRCQGGKGRESSRAGAQEPE